MTDQRKIPFLNIWKDLERENKILEAQLNQLKSRGPSNLAEKYEEELRRLRQMVDKLTHERAQAEMLRDNYANESEQWHEKYDEELVSIHFNHIIWTIVYGPYDMDYLETSRQLINNEQKYVSIFFNSFASIDHLCPAFFR